MKTINKTICLCIGIPIIEIRQSRDCLIFIMGIPIHGKMVLYMLYLYIAMAPWCILQVFFLKKTQSGTTLDCIIWLYCLRSMNLLNLHFHTSMSLGVPPEGNCKTVSMETGLSSHTFGVVMWQNAAWIFSRLKLGVFDKLYPWHTWHHFADWSISLIRVQMGCA